MGLTRRCLSVLQEAFFDEKKTKRERNPSAAKPNKVLCFAVVERVKSIAASCLCAQLSRYSLCVKFVSLYNLMSVGSKSLQCKCYGQILFGCGPRYYLFFYALPHALLFSKILLLFLFGEKTNHIYGIGIPILSAVQVADWERYERAN